eukprot:m.100051 g.100051  ORF g.100051 m.100051 type:complete len:599 (-) comp13158_c0_seq1:885-2681(-)
MSVVAVCLAVLASVFPITNAEGTCLAPTGSITYTFAESGCSPGYYCPFLASNASAIPEVCTPTTQCAVQRLAGQFCTEAQGSLEPLLCPEGFYCPNTTTKAACPEGFYCPVGTIEPLDCGVAYCGQNTTQPQLYLPIVVAVGIDLLLLCIYCVSCKGCMSVYYTRHAAASGMELGAAFDRAASTGVSAKDLTVRKGGKTILHKVSFSAPPAQLTAIMGPSGAGKTTCLQALLGHCKIAGGTIRAVRRSNRKVSAGSVAPMSWDSDSDEEVDLEELAQISSATTDTASTLVGYVPQDDVLFPFLTVRENITHSALVHLCHLPKLDRVNYANAVIEEMQLGECADNVVGDGVYSRGVSGGQRKRCSIGVTLAMSPDVLIVDEPTSGLDATTSLDIMRVLHRLTTHGVTVISVIHQPRTEIFNLLDNIVLLQPGGRLLYQGPREGAQTFVQSRFSLDIHGEGRNPADSLLDVCVEAAQAASGSKEEGEHELVSATPRRCCGGRDAGGDETHWAVSGRSTASVLYQTWLCFRRSLLEQTRDYKNFMVEVFIALLAGGLMGLSAGSADRIYQGVLKNEYVLLSPAPNNTLWAFSGFLSDYQSL